MSSSGKQKKRFPISLPPYHEKRLIWWAEMNSTTKTTLTQTKLQALIEAEEDHIETMLKDRADDLQIEVEELKRRLLEKNGFNPDDD